MRSRDNVSKVVRVHKPSAICSNSTSRLPRSSSSTPSPAPHARPAPCSQSMRHVCHTPYPCPPRSIHPPVQPRPRDRAARAPSAHPHRRPPRPSLDPPCAPVSPNDALVDRLLLLLALQARHVLGQIVDGQYPRKLHVLDLAVAVAEGNKGRAARAGRYRPVRGWRANVVIAMALGDT